LTSTHIHRVAKILGKPEIEQASRGGCLDAAHCHEIVELVDAVLRAVDLLDAYVEIRAAPADKFLKIGFHDRAKAAVVTFAARHPADRIGKGVAIVGENKTQTGLLELCANFTPIRELLQIVRQGQRRCCRVLAATGKTPARFRR
jgi:hypothetical protein